MGGVGLCMMSSGSGRDIFVYVRCCIYIMK